jgi:hypothetical protein
VLDVEVGLPRAGADARLGLHLLHQRLEVRRRQLEVEIELADVVELRGIDRLVAGVEGLDHAAAELAVAAVRPAQHAHEGEARGVLGQDLRRLVPRSVVDQIHSAGGTDWPTTESSVRRA